WSYSAPADYNLWREYVSRLVDYVVGRGYRGAHYEILNEPEDTSCWRGKPGSKDTLADYLEFYLHTAATIKSVDPSAKVGGPASAHWDSVTVSGGAHAWGLPQFLRALAGYAQAHPAESLPLDFISWHDYAFSSTRLSDGADFVDRILAEVKWPVKPEYWVTEWNRSLSDAGVAGHERASHAAWNIIREANPETRRIARLYWYVLDGGGNTALADDTIPVLESQDGVPSARLSPTFAVFEMLRELNRGEYVR
ncbi:MAG: hypothetical protein GTN78_02625, partial [Gemmatimonadales bacterium]|nr:hypothetical protein [Gemmatimonadales bacterium]